MKLRTIALRNIFRNRRRSILSAIAITIATMSITLLFSFLEGLRSDIFYNTQSFLVGEARVRNRDFDTYENLNPTHLVIDDAAELTARIDALPEVALVAPRIEFPTVIFIKGEEFRAIGNGVDFDRELEFQKIGELITAGRLPEPGRAEALVGRGLADEIGLTIGDRFTSLVTTRRRASNAFTVEIVGLVDFPLQGLSQTRYYIPLDRAQYFLRMGDAVIDILAKADPAYSIEELVASIEQGPLQASGVNQLDSGESSLDARSWDTIGFAYSIIQSAQVSYSIIALFFFILGSTVIINTTMMVIFERTREIGTLAAMGMRGSELVRLFLLEAIFIAIAGAAAGVGLGILLTLPLSIWGIDISGQISGVDLDVSNILFPRVSIYSTVVVFIYSVIIAALASLIPSLRTGRIHPVDALRTASMAS